jgi:hypothetical protein
VRPGLRKHAGPDPLGLASERVKPLNILDWLKEQDR